MLSPDNISVSRKDSAFLENPFRTNFPKQKCPTFFFGSRKYQATVRLGGKIRRFERVIWIGCLRYYTYQVGVDIAPGLTQTV